MDKDNNTKSELNKEEYLKSLFNGAKEELEAYIESKEESLSGESDLEESAGSELEIDAHTDTSLTADNVLDEDNLHNTEATDNTDLGQDVTLGDSESEEASGDELEDGSDTEGDEIADASLVVEDGEKSSEKKSNASIDDIEKRRIKRKRKLKMPGFFTRIFIVVGVTIAMIAFSLSSFFTVDTIDVQGNKYYTRRNCEYGACEHWAKYYLQAKQGQYAQVSGKESVYR
nr:hypothetical protein [uncultured Mogibacterium sp.]